MIFAKFNYFQTDLSVNGHPQRQSQQPSEYYYYDDDYYYNDELTGSRNTESPVAVANTKAKATEDQPDELSEAKEAIAQYDIDELVKAWREYMEEKEHKEQEKEAPISRFFIHFLSFSLFKIVIIVIMAL